MAWEGAGRRRGRRKKEKIQAEQLPRLGASGFIELRARRAIQSIYAGSHQTKAYGSSVEFVEHRSYQPGDDLRNVDWKAYGRSDQLVIRLFRDERHLSLASCFDCSASMSYGDPDKFTCGRIMAAIVSLLALDQRDRVDVFYGGTSLHRAEQSYHGPHDAQALCQGLEQLNTTGALDFVHMNEAMVGHLQRSSVVLWVSDFYDDIEHIRKGLQILHQHGHEAVMLHVLDKTEVELPADWDQVEFVDPEESLQSISGNARQLADEYNDMVQAHIDQCRQSAIASGAEYLLVQTHQDPVDILLPWLVRRQHQTRGVR